MKRSDNAMIGTSGYERNDRDWYPTPPDAIYPIVDFIGNAGNVNSIWECAAGDGAMGDVLGSITPNVYMTDIHPLRGDIRTFNFLNETHETMKTDWIITNPPYGKMAEEFIKKGFEYMKSGQTGGFALLMRHEYDCASTRNHYFDHPYFYGKLTLLWRPRWIVGSLGSPRHNYSWYVWHRDNFDGSQIYYYRKPK